MNRRQRTALTNAGHLSFEALDPRFAYRVRDNPRAKLLTVILTVQAGYE